MTTWTLRQIDQAERLWCVRLVSHQATLDSAGLAAELAGAAAAEELVAAAHTFGVELHPGDLSVEARDMSELVATEITVRWRPTTREVVLVGGPADGAVCTFSRVPEPLTVTLVLTGVPHLGLEGDRNEAVLGTEGRVYSLSGWHERDRRWVYAP